MGIVGWWVAVGVALGADTGVAMDLSGGSTPAALNTPLREVLRDGLRERGVPTASYHGSARGTPLLGTQVSAGLEVTCGDGSVRKHDVTDLAVPVSSGDNSWSRVAKAVGSALLESVDCSAPPPPAPPAEATEAASSTPEVTPTDPTPTDPTPTDPTPTDPTPTDPTPTDGAAVDTGVEPPSEPPDASAAEPEAPIALSAPVGAADPVAGTAQPGPYQDALTSAFRRAIEREAGLTAVGFSGSARGRPLFGVSASATAEVVCSGTSHEVTVTGIQVPLGDTRGWDHIGDAVVERLLRDLPCE